MDNSSAFRMTEGVPLVIPEVNPKAMSHIKLGSGKGAIIANPNCSTIIALMAVTPLDRVANVKRMVVSTYQVGICQWDSQTRISQQYFVNEEERTRFHCIISF